MDHQTWAEECKIMTLLQRLLITLAWIQTVLAFAGSLYFSEVMKLAPCVLCWYQRICMYPLVVILGISFLFRRLDALSYALPLAVIGWCISSYHNLLYYKIIPEPVGLCAAGVSCTTRYITWFGFITIPLLAWIAFTIIILLLLLTYAKNLTKSS
jgi:disulfide bond formation protein DsbB